MTLKNALVIATLVAAAAMPAAAQFRDSDGNVISVIDYDYIKKPDGVYYTLYTTTGVQYQVLPTTMMDGVTSVPEQTPVPGQVSVLEQVSVQGQTYRVESSGTQIYLRAEGSTQRIPVKVQNAQGRRVNPTAFALD